MRNQNYSTKRDYTPTRDGRNGSEFGITTAAKFNRYAAKRESDRKAAQSNESNRAKMVAWGLNPNDADMIFA